MAAIAATQGVYRRLNARSAAAATGDRAIDVHVSALRHKLNDAVGPAISIASIRGFGYQMSVLDDSAS